jgi:hypothetical protein
MSSKHFRNVCKHSESLHNTGDELAGDGFVVNEHSGGSTACKTCRGAMEHRRAVPSRPLYGHIGLQNSTKTMGLLGPHVIAHKGPGTLCGTQPEVTGAHVRTLRHACNARRPARSLPTSR